MIRNPKYLLVIIVLLATVAPTFAQNSLQLRGLVDMVGHGQDDLSYLNSNNTADGNFDPLRARLFVDGARENTQVHLQFLFSQESFSQVRLFGAYILQRLIDDKEHYLEVGKVPTHDGIWAHNTYSNKNPLIGTPLAYYWKSTLPSRSMPVDLDQLLSFKGQGQTSGIAYTDANGVRGSFYATAPIAYDNCWNYGIYSLGTAGKVEYAVGATVGTPGVPVAETNTNDSYTMHAKLGYAVLPGLTTYASWAHGAYLSRDVVPYLPTGKTINDYYQDLWILSADWRFRSLHAIGEVFFSNYDTPIAADGLSSQSFYVQGVYKVFTGWDVAARFDQLRYGNVTGSNGTESWDADVHRIESGIIYHVSRDLRVKAVVQATRMGNEAWDDNVLPAVQMSFAF